MKKYLILLILVVAFACKKEQSEPVNNIKSIELGGGGDQVVNASNEFGLDIFKEIASDEPADKNLFISPTSISLALSMTWNGANTNTEEAIAEALRFPNLDADEINSVNRNLIDGLTTVDDKVLLNIANSIWYRQNFTVEEDFKTINQLNYDAEIRGLDFGDPGAKDIINGWVEDKTNGKIKDLVNEVNNDYVMFLINAIYFKGTWQIEFNKESTTDAGFSLLNGDYAIAKMMSMRDTLSYFKNDLFQSVELDYGIGNYSMIIMLPNYDKNTDDIIKNLTPANWNNWINSYSKTDLALSMPRFKFDYKIKLNNVLTEMGMGIAFTGAADFTGINKNGGLAIDYVLHKSFVEVNEEGTEAAAATVVAVYETSMPGGPTFESMYVNHPFIFAIREKSTGAIVFLGRVCNPQE